MHKAVKTARLSIISNSTLIVIKTIAGILSGSVSIVSEAIHSFIDLLAAIIAFFQLEFPINLLIVIILTDMENLKIFQEL